MLGWWVYQKLARAEFHLDILDEMIAGFLKKRPYGLTSDFEPAGEGRWKWVRKAIVREYPGDVAWPLGDCVYNMRSSLDYIANHLAYLHSGGIHLQGAEFPIFLHESKYIAADKKGPKRSSGLYKIRGLDPVAQDKITDLQPFQPCRGSDKDPLWRLQELSNHDKHRMITMGGYWLGDAAELGIKSVANVRVLSSETFPGPFKHDTVLAEAVIEFLNETDSGVMDVNQQFPAEIAFDKTPGVAGLLVVPTLREILGYIRSTVIPKLEPFGESVPA